MVRLFAFLCFSYFAFQSQAQSLEAGLWKLKEKETATSIEIVVGASADSGRFALASSSKTSDIDIVGVRAQDGVLTFLFRGADSADFGRKYYSVLKAEKGKLSLGAAKLEKTSGTASPKVAPDLGKGEIAIFTLEN